MRRTLILLAIILVAGAIVFFFPRQQEVVVLDKIQKRAWFTVPVIAEDNLSLIISTDAGYFYVKGEFDADGIRHIFKKMEPGKTYKIDYVGVRFNPIWIYPFISSFRETP